MSRRSSRIQAQAQAISESESESTESDSTSESDPPASNVGRRKRKAGAPASTTTSQPSKKARGGGPKSAAGRSQPKSSAEVPSLSVAPPRRKAAPPPSTQTTVAKPRARRSEAQAQVTPTPSKVVYEAEDGGDRAKDGQEVEKSQDEPGVPPKSLVPIVNVNDSDVEMGETASSVQAYSGAQDTFTRDDLAGSSRTTGGTSRGKALGNTFNYADFENSEFEPHLTEGYIYGYYHDGNPATFKPSATVLPSWKMQHNFEPGMTVHRIVDACRQMWPGLSGNCYILYLVYVG